MSVIHRIITAIAEETGTQPTDLPPLYHTIDPDAVQALIDDAPTEQLHLSFSYSGYRVSVHGDGTIDYAKD